MRPNRLKLPVFAEVRMTSRHPRTITKSELAQESLPSAKSAVAHAFFGALARLAVAGGGHRSRRGRSGGGQE